ncbi:MAG: HAMP domain-containing sensor histidine kinase [Pirellulaceae bacterium]|nr:HAMP domain-containing sensor histidine kinase [Pirellulaceae bacterium]
MEGLAAAPPATALEQAKLEALYQFAYGLSHEINNPLANIATRAQTLLVDERDPERRRKLAVINQQAFRAHEMIADLMLFARPPAPQFQPVDLVDLARRVVAEWQPAAREQGTTLSLAADAGPLSCLADPAQLAVALRALIQNSLEALQSGGKIEVQCSKFNVQGFPSNQTLNLEPRTLNFVLSVSDTGPGISAAAREHIFDPFFCGREAGRGLGLGLSKAWRIVQLHGGDIQVESPPSGGAKFTIALPG